MANLQLSSGVISLLSELGGCLTSVSFADGKPHTDRTTCVCALDIKLGMHIHPGSVCWTPVDATGSAGDDLHTREQACSPQSQVQ